jgi:hypothetical protein
MKNNWLAFLFGESQINDELEGLSEDLERIFESTETEDELVAKKTPLANALKALNVKTDTLEMDAGTFCIYIDDDREFHKVSALLSTPDNVEKLAKMGWIVTRCGDGGMTNEPPDYKIRFLEIAVADSENDNGKGKMAEIIKKGREFATTPLEPSDQNPVDHSEPKKATKNKGVGDAPDGEKTALSMHGYREDAQKVAAQFLDDAPKRLQIEAKAPQSKGKSRLKSSE